jgi:hypothetical protein
MRAIAQHAAAAALGFESGGSGAAVGNAVAERQRNDVRAAHADAKRDGGVVIEQDGDGARGHARGDVAIGRHRRAAPLHVAQHRQPRLYAHSLLYRTPHRLCTNSLASSTPNCSLLARVDHHTTLLTCRSRLRTLPQHWLASLFDMISKLHIDHLSNLYRCHLFCCYLPHNHNYYYSTYNMEVLLE